MLVIVQRVEGLAGLLLEAAAEGLLLVVFVVEGVVVVGGLGGHQTRILLYMARVYKLRSLLAGMRGREIFASFIVFVDIIIDLLVFVTRFRDHQTSIARPHLTLLLSLLFLLSANIILLNRMLY